MHGAPCACGAPTWLLFLILGPRKCRIFAQTLVARRLGTLLRVRRPAFLQILNLNRL
jgi:hypothetical protein